MAKRKEPFDVGAAKQYLSSKGIETSSTNETYVKRLYNSARKTEATGQAPSRRAARGHGGYKYVPRNDEKHHLGRWQFRSRTSLNDIKRFVKEHPNKKMFTFTVTGIANQDSPTRKVKRDTSKPLTLSMGGVPRYFVEDAIEANEHGKGATGNSMLDFINDISHIGLTWYSVEEVSIVDFGS